MTDRPLNPGASKPGFFDAHQLISATDEKYNELLAKFIKSDLVGR